MTLIIRTILLFEHPITYCIPIIRTPTPCGAWTVIAEHLLTFDSTARVTECLLAYYCRFRISTRLLAPVTAELKRGLPNVYILAFDRLCGARTGVGKCVLAFDSLCGGRTGVGKRVLAFDSLCGARTGVAKHAIAITISADLKRGLENV